MVTRNLPQVCLDTDVSKEKLGWIVNFGLQDNLREVLVII